MPDAVLAYNRLSITPPSIALPKCYTLVDRSCGLHRRSCCDFLFNSNLPITRSRSLEGKDREPRPYDYQRGDGTRAWVRISAEPIQDRDGYFIGVVVGIIDIDREKRVEEALPLAAAPLEYSNRELAHFASIASHDLQEPQRKIRTFGDQIK